MMTTTTGENGADLAATAARFDAMTEGEQAGELAVATLHDARRPAENWPILSRRALHGIAGQFVDTIEPQSEADPVALLMSILVGASALLRGPHLYVESTRHDPRLNVIMVGETSRARKGTAGDHGRRIILKVDHTLRIAFGLSSGEGLIHAVRDPVQGIDKKTGQTKVTDPGEPDKRLLVIETEAGSTLRVMRREGNTLSPTLRQAWDGSTLRIISRSSPYTAIHPHIAIIGHITLEELERNTDVVEAAGGLFNRFLIVLVRRSKILPFGGRVGDDALMPIIEGLRAAQQFAATDPCIGWSPEAAKMWRRVYPELTQPRSGLTGMMLARSEAQAVRLAMLYAVLDCSRVIEPDHLRAGLAIIEYVEESVALIFGDSSGDPIADQLLAILLEDAPKVMSRSEIRSALGRHVDAKKLARALTRLAEAGKAAKETQPTAGRPAELWHAVHQGEG